MGETTYQIRTEIAHTRERLGRDLDELQHRVKREADVRVHVRRHPYAVGAVAVVFVIATVFAVRRMLA